MSVLVFHTEQGLVWEFCIWMWTPVRKPCYQSDCRPLCDWHLDAVGFCKAAFASGASYSLPGPWGCYCRLPASLKWCVASATGLQLLSWLWSRQTMHIAGSPSSSRSAAVGSWSILEANGASWFCTYGCKESISFVAECRESGIYVLFHLCDTAGRDCMFQMLSSLCCGWITCSNAFKGLTNWSEHSEALLPLEGIVS